MQENIPLHQPNRHINHRTPPPCGTATSLNNTSNPQIPSQQQDSHPTRNTNALYLDSQTPILLQTARLQLCDPEDSAWLPACAEVMAIIDNYNQCTYFTGRVKHTLQLPISGIEILHIKTFGSSKGQDAMCETVECGLLLKNGDMITIQALVVPFICNLLNNIYFKVLTVSKFACSAIQRVGFMHPFTTTQVTRSKPYYSK